MRTTITTNHGTYTGQRVDTIIRREYGRRAEFLPSSDPSSDQAGEVGRWEPKLRAYHVLAKVKSIETTKATR